MIGIGYWGKGLARNLAELGALAAICDVDTDRLQWAGRNYPGVRLVSDVEAILEKRQVDAVVIATPPPTHYALARTCLEGGCHVLLEKPFTCSSREAGELVELAEKKGLTLMGGFTFLYNEAVRRVKEYIDAGELGEVYYVLSQRLSLGRVRSDVDVWWNLGPHDVSIILYWFGDTPVEVSGWGVSYLQRGKADVAFVALRFADGRSAFIHVSWLHPNKVRSATVVGSSKMLVYDDTSLDMKIQLFDRGVDRSGPGRGVIPFENFAQFQLIHRTGDIHIPKVDFEEPLRRECRAFLDCIQGNGRCPTDGRMSLRVLKVLEAVDRSMGQNGRPVSVELDRDKFTAGPLNEQGDFGHKTG